MFDAMPDTATVLPIPLDSCWLPSSVLLAAPLGRAVEPSGGALPDPPFISYWLLPASWIVTSHCAHVVDAAGSMDLSGASGRPDPRYPGGLQGRNYSASRGRYAFRAVLAAAEELDPSMLLDLGAAVAVGPPVLVKSPRYGDRFYTVCGNHRAMAIHEAMRSHPERISAYLRALNGTVKIAQRIGTEDEIPVSASAAFVEIDRASEIYSELSLRDGQRERGAPDIPVLVRVLSLAGAYFAAAEGSVATVSAVVASHVGAEFTGSQASYLRAINRASDVPFSKELPPLNESRSLADRIVSAGGAEGSTLSWIISSLTDAEHSIKHMFDDGGGIALLRSLHATGVLSTVEETAMWDESIASDPLADVGSETEQLLRNAVRMLAVGSEEALDVFAEPSDPMLRRIERSLGVMVVLRGIPEFALHREVGVALLELRSARESGQLVNHDQEEFPFDDRASAGSLDSAPDVQISGRLRSVIFGAKSSQMLFDGFVDYLDDARAGVDSSRMAMLTSAFPLELEAEVLRRLRLAVSPAERAKREVRVALAAWNTTAAKAHAVARAEQPSGGTAATAKPKETRGRKPADLKVMFLALVAFQELRKSDRPTITRIRHRAMQSQILDLLQVHDELRTVSLPSRRTFEEWIMIAQLVRTQKDAAIPRVGHRARPSHFARYMLSTGGLVGRRLDQIINAFGKQDSGKERKRRPRSRHGQEELYLHGGQTEFIDGAPR